MAKVFTVDFFEVILANFSIFFSVSHLQTNTIDSFAEAMLLFFLPLSDLQAILISFLQLFFLQFHQSIITTHVCICFFPLLSFEIAPLLYPQTYLMAAYALTHD